MALASQPVPVLAPGAGQGGTGLQPHSPHSSAELQQVTVPDSSSLLSNCCSQQAHSLPAASFLAASSSPWDLTGILPSSSALACCAYNRLGSTTQLHAQLTAPPSAGPGLQQC